MVILLFNELFDLTHCIAGTTSDRQKPNQSLPSSLAATRSHGCYGSSMALMPQHRLATWSIPSPLAVASTLTHSGLTFLTSPANHCISPLSPATYDPPLLP